MRICLTIAAKSHLSEVFAKEVVENPDAVFRIWEFTSGRYNDASIRLGLILDEASDDDEQTFCCELPFVASKDFLSLRGEPHVFCVFLDKDGKIGVYAF